MLEILLFSRYQDTVEEGDGILKQFATVFLPLHLFYRTYSLRSIFYS